MIVGKLTKVTMGTKSFLSAASEKGVTADLQTKDGKHVASFGIQDQSDVVARLQPNDDVVELHGKTLLGRLFIMLLAEGG